jgi:exodeoxyribonuclease-5
MAEWSQEEKNQKKLWARLKTDPLANALQIKFGYALTCHKAQGGQWDAVFIDHGFLKEGPLDTEFYRWLYTALTRARKEVYIINPDSRLLQNSDQN